LSSFINFKKTKIMPLLGGILLTVFQIQNNWCSLAIRSQPTKDI
jgi:hypothetical protein